MLNNGTFSHHIPKHNHQDIYPSSPKGQEISFLLLGQQFFFKYASFSFFFFFQNHPPPPHQITNDLLLKGKHILVLCLDQLAC